MKRFLSTSVLLLFLVGVCRAQPSPSIGDTASSVGGVTSYSSGNFAVSGSNVCLIACIYNVSGSGSQVTSAVTWNDSEAFTQFVVQGTEPGDAGNISFWYLLGPTQTTENVDVSITDISTSVLQVFTVTGCKQSAPTLSDTDSAGPTASADLTTVAANTLLLTCAGDGNAADTFTYGSGQTELAVEQNGTGSGITSGSSYEVKVTPGLETLTTTSETSTSMRYVVMGVEPAAAPPAGSARRRGQGGSFE